MDGPFNTNQNYKYVICNCQNFSKFFSLENEHRIVKHGNFVRKSVGGVMVLSNIVWTAKKNFFRDSYKRSSPYPLNRVFRKFLQEEFSNRVFSEVPSGNISSQVRRFLQEEFLQIFFLGDSFPLREGFLPKCPKILMEFSDKRFFRRFLNIPKNMDSKKINFSRMPHKGFLEIFFFQK